MQRECPEFSACGLNCGLCPRYHTNGKSRCTGCGAEGFFNPACAIIKCCERHGGLQFCARCGEYPCKRYTNLGDTDSWITHRNQLSDNAKLQDIGEDAYLAELNEKVEILRALLENYNDGRRKSYYCIATNVLSLQDLRDIMTKLAKTENSDESAKEKAVRAIQFLEDIAQKRGIILKLRKRFC